MSRQLRPSPHCLNCGHEVTRRFCSECGQENTTYKVSLGRLLGDLVEEVFQLESRLWRSLWDLARHPGRLTREYNAGRRVHYTSPLRLYLLASVVYFFTAAVMPPNKTIIHADFKDSQKELKELGPPKNALEKRVRERLGILDKLDPVETSRRARDILVSNTPKVMAVLVPLFALLVMMLFWRHYFVEHLVFALHAHALTFMLLTLSALTRRPGWDVAAMVLALVWTVVALRNVYQRSWYSVTWKALLLAFLYAILLSIGIGFAMIGGMLLF